MKNDKLSNILGLYLLAALAGAGLLGFFVIKPLVASGRATAAKVATVNQQIVALNQLDEDTKKLRDNYESVKDQRDAVLQLLPVQSEEERLLALLNDLAASSGVVLSSFSPASPDNGTKNLTSLSVYPVSVNISGAYPQIQQFLTKVENSARFINVLSANQSGGASGKQAVSLGVVLTLNAYYQGSTAGTGSVALTGAAK